MFHDNNRDSEVWLCFMIGTVNLAVFHDKDSEVWLCFMIGTVNLAVFHDRDSESGCVS